ncbi:dTDP-4-dehydrorhamnose 3,5-epimerase family protein [Lacisediminihabitans sp. H27-G8]|uniref:dTDP-4-dehydrorhamnose 3,5-epimerase family protein n=1 Tax=Lacisediminihabitans sp. H27-G8 TaxID=3111909 RepID=UPI0038FBE90F
MQIRQLSIPDAYEVTPIQRSDDRGIFFEWYRHDRLEQTIGHSLDLRQANSSTSKKGVVRGIHFADVPIGQAKYVTATHGAVLDFVVDIRVGSPTFGLWDSVVLDDIDHRAVYIAEGLGHAFVALTEGAVVTYLVSDVYRSEREHGINPLDEQLALDFRLPRPELILSPKDVGAPSLAEAASGGLLPSWQATTDYYSSLNAGMA